MDFYNKAWLWLSALFSPEVLIGHAFCAKCSSAWSVKTKVEMTSAHSVLADVRSHCNWGHML